MLSCISNEQTTTSTRQYVFYDQMVCLTITVVCSMISIVYIFRTMESAACADKNDTFMQSCCTKCCVNNVRVIANCIYV